MSSPFQVCLSIRFTALTEQKLALFLLCIRFKVLPRSRPQRPSPVFSSQCCSFTSTSVVFSKLIPHKAGSTKELFLLSFGVWLLSCHLLRPVLLCRTASVSPSKISKAHKSLRANPGSSGLFHEPVNCPPSLCILSYDFHPFSIKWLTTFCFTLSPLDKGPSVCIVHGCIPSAADTVKACWLQV